MNAGRSGLLHVPSTCTCADPSGLIGRAVQLSGGNYTVVGILQRGFLFPFRDATLAVPTPLRADPRRSDRGANFLRVVARLGPGVGLERAKSDLDAIAVRLQRSYPNEDSRKIGVNLYPLHTEIVRDYQQILWTLFAAVLLFLAIGCGNLAKEVQTAAFNRGLIVETCGSRDEAIKCIPPLTISEVILQRGLDILEDSVQACAPIAIGEPAIELAVAS